MTYSPTSGVLVTYLRYYASFNQDEASVLGYTGTWIRYGDDGFSNGVTRDPQIVAGNNKLYTAYGINNTLNVVNYPNGAPA